MDKKINSEPIKVKKTTTVNLIVEQNSSKIINSVGYAILFFTLLDYAFLFSYSNFFNPVWGWENAGRLVETSWAPLLGFLLIFYRRDQDEIKSGELSFLSFLSWLALFLAIVYFAIAPILIGNGFRIHRIHKAQLINQINQQKAQVQQYNQQLNQATNEKLNILLQNYRKQAPNTTIVSGQELKENIFTEIQEKQKTAQAQLQNGFNEKEQNLIKKTLKWLIGTIVSGLSFILIWNYTQWARVLRSNINVSSG